MSRILKRPMFRKGGEVMEGVMTNIVPSNREMFADKGLSDSMKDELKNVRQRVNMIDAISGAGSNPLSNNLTQFLLRTGANLIGGTAAGGTKLQEIVGAAQQPLEAAIKTQQQKDASRRKLAATMLSKMGGTDIAKLQRQAKRISELTGRDYKTTLDSLIRKFMYKDPTDPDEIARKDKGARVKGLTSKKNLFKQPELNQYEAEEIDTQYQKAIKYPELQERIDIGQIYLPKDVDYEAAKEKTKAGKTIYASDDLDDLIDGNIYYSTQLRTWVLVDKANKRLIQQSRL